MFTLLDEIELVYPIDTNILRIDRAPRKVRQLKVTSIRDLYADPLTPEEFFRRPFIARSRWLITALDVESKTYRRFYPGTADNYRAPGTLQLGLYEPGARKPKKLIGKLFEPSPRDRQLIVRVIQSLEKEHRNLQVRITSLDLRLRTA